MENPTYKLGQYLTGEQIKEPITEHIKTNQETARLMLNYFSINVLAIDQYIRQQTKVHLEELVNKSDK